MDGAGEAVQVLIVGAGPTGLTAANLLGRYGVRTLVVERNAGVSASPKALFVDDEFFRTVNGLGLGEALAAHALAPVGFEYRSPLGVVLASIPGRVTLNGFHNRNAIFQPAFERILLDGATARHVVAVRFGHALESFVQDGGGVTARVIGPDGAAATIAADYLLACDGAHSGVRRALGMELEEVTPFRQRHLVVDAVDDADDSRTAVLICDPRRPFTTLPVPGRGRRFEITLHPDDDADAVLADDVLAGFFRPWRDFSQVNVIRKVVYAFHARLAPRLQEGRVFLLGDAAHVMPPFGSQGMNSGARDANNIAWKLAAVLTGAAAPALLDTYHVERHDQVRATILTSTNMARIANTPSRAKALARDGFFAALSLFPRLKRRLTEAPYVPRPVLTDGFILPAADAGAAWVGTVVPQPLVRDAAGGRLLDDVIGPGFALIGIDPPAGAAPAGLADPSWRALGAAPLALRPAGSPAGVVDGVFTGAVADPRFDDLFAAVPGCWLVVRPDRVVAAVAEPERLAQAGRALAARLAPAAAEAAA
ncbi:MAG: FAD-dependent monooxygenase [Rhodospirillaceae bacterium]